MFIQLKSTAGPLYLNIGDIVGVSAAITTHQRQVSQVWVRQHEEPFLALETPEEIMGMIRDHVTVLPAQA